MTTVSNAQPNRLPQGGLVDRTCPLHFSFEGRSYSGFEGDTLASALLANGVRIVGRSFKYHRPRGLMGAGVEEPNGLVQLGAGARLTPNVRATEVQLHDGLVADPVNCWPSARFDLGAVISLASRFVPAGFYYKTFKWPHWHFYEWAIRRAAGLGVASREADPDRYESRFAHCDVLIVGGGPAGLVAARTAARSGARVILVEQDRLLGSQLCWDDRDIDGIPAADWVRRTLSELNNYPETIVLKQTVAAGYFDHNAVALVESLPGDTESASQAGVSRQRLWQVRAKRVVLATGAIERPLVFSGNDRPGVMLASAVLQYIKRYAVTPGRKAVVFTNNDSAYATAHALLDAGVSLAAVVDIRPAPAAELLDAITSRGVNMFAGAEIIETYGETLRRVAIRTADGTVLRLHCDLLAMSGGANPAVQLFCQSGGKLAFDDDLALFRPDVSVQAEESVGAAAGTLTLQGALQEGHRAGERAAIQAGFTIVATEPPHTPGDGCEPKSIAPCWQIEGRSGKAFVNFQNDVTADDIALAARENFVSVEHLKRYTTLGMATDQGKTSNVNALAIMAGLTNRGVPEAGTTRDRFPFTPQSLGVLAASARGARWKPQRQLPSHAWHEANGAIFEEYAGWTRPAYYARAGENAAAAEQREARTVRQSVGLFDGSPLGKIEVVGVDAADFLDRIYANTMSTIATGKLRYGLMLNEVGVIIDDGVAARFAGNHFLLSTTSSGASRIATWLEEWRQCEWPQLRVIVAPVTAKWAVLTLTGPRARAVLQDIGTDFGLAPDEFPHMTFRIGHVAGIPARVLRASFTGEVSFEINVPAGRATELWDLLMRAGAPHGIAPIGIDAWMLLRTEKGYLHVGADTDGTTCPDDVGWGHVLKKAGDFVGKRSLTQPENLRPDRLQLVGLEAIATKEALVIGAHLRGEAQSRGETSEGYITSSGYSPTLERGVALAMIRGGRGRLGEIVNVIGGGATSKARIVSPGAFDPKGARLNA